MTVCLFIYLFLMSAYSQRCLFSFLPPVDWWLLGFIFVAVIKVEVYIKLKLKSIFVFCVALMGMQGWQWKYGKHHTCRLWSKMMMIHKHIGLIVYYAEKSERGSRSVKATVPLHVQTGCTQFSSLYSLTLMPSLQWALWWWNLLHTRSEHFRSSAKKSKARDQLKLNEIVLQPIEENFAAISDKNVKNPHSD